MKKFTFIAMLMLFICGMAKADDKYFFKVPTDKFSSGWVVQDAGNFEQTPGKEYLEVYNKKNGGQTQADPMKHLQCNCILQAFPHSRM